jgi:hypothetical protein
MKLVAAGALAPDISLSTTSPVTSVIIRRLTRPAAMFTACKIRGCIPQEHQPRNLATINDAAENRWLSLLWCGGRSLWLRFNDAEAEGRFVWRRRIQLLLPLGGLSLLNPGMGSS